MLFNHCYDETSAYGSDVQPMREVSFGHVTLVYANQKAGCLSRDSKKFFVVIMHREDYVDKLKEILAHYFTSNIGDIDVQSGDLLLESDQ